MVRSPDTSFIHLKKCKTVNVYKLTKSTRTFRINFLSLQPKTNSTIHTQKY